MSEPTVVLVHGGWGGPWCWRDFAKVLESHGVAYATPQLPSSQPGARPEVNLIDDARAISDVVNALTGPIILVGHSYGGAVVSQSAPQLTNVERVVFVAAMGPLTGQSATDTSREVRNRTNMDDAISVEDGFLLLDPLLASDALYNKCDQPIASWATNQLGMQTLASFRTPRSSPNLNVPTRYISCTDDHALHPALQEVMAQRCDQTMSLVSDHSPMFSDPDALFRALMGGAR